MMALVALIAQGAFFFVEAEAPGIQVSGVNSLTGEPTVNFRHADVNGNGLPDLVFGDRVIFQTPDGFATEPLPLPEPRAASLVDVWENAVYRLFPDRLERLEWDEGDWNRTEFALDTGIAPKGGGAYSLSDRRRTAPPQLSRFLHDIAQDGIPAVVTADEKGIRIYALGSSSPYADYKSVAYHAVFPAIRPARPTTPNLWPPEAREVVLPATEMSCRFYLDGPRLTVIDRESLPDQTAVFRITRYRIDSDNGYAFDPEYTQEFVTEPLPDHLQPCRLTDNDLVSFAGGEWTLSRDSMVPSPVFETSVTTDGGHTIQHVRTRSFRPLCLFVDFNGNGRRDLIAETTGLAEGGLRETVTRFTTQHSVRHGVQVHLQAPDGTFPPRPDIQGQFNIQIEHPPLQSGELYHRYQSGELVNLSGDFSGDGFRDLVIQERPDRLAIYRGSASGFSSRPFLTLPMEPGWRFSVADIDGDGLSDIIVRFADAEAGPEGEGKYLFLTRSEDRS